MGATDRIETQFRKRLKALRGNRELSQAQLANMLSNKGLAVYPTTIAKIEAGDRAPRIDEIAAIADVFEVSIDALIGRSVNRVDDFMFAFRAAVDTAQRAMWQVESTDRALRDAIAELTAFGEKGAAKTFASGCGRACDALTDAQDALRNVLWPKQGKELQRTMRRMLIEGLKKEDAEDEAEP
jgi:transcriptional regulator with XRE-family HTH domain